MLRVAPHIAWNNVDGELALFDSRDGSYHALNGSGAAIWRAVAAGYDGVGLVDALARQFDAPRSEIEASVAEFISAARTKGLLEQSV